MIETTPKATVFRPGQGVHWSLPINDNRLPRNMMVKRVILFLAVLGVATGLFFL